MLTSLLLPAPAQTTNYMIAGYAVIFGVMLLYIVSLVLRAKNLKRETQMLNELEKNDQ